MAGTSTKTKPVAARMPVDLAEWIETQGKAGDVIVRAVRALKDGVTGDAPDQRPVVLQTLVSQLEAENARLTIERDKWRTLAQAAMPLAKTDAKPIAHHAAGPVLPATGLKVRGTARPMFRPGTNADKATKSG